MSAVCPLTLRKVNEKTAQSSYYKFRQMPILRGFLQIAESQKKSTVIFDSCQAHHDIKPFEAIQTAYFFLEKVQFLAFFLQIDTIIARNYPRYS